MKMPMHVLYLTTVFPRSKLTGGEIAAQSFVDALEAIGHLVTVVAYERPERPLALLENEVSVGPRFIESSSAPLLSLRSLFRSAIQGLPYSATKYISKQYKEAVRLLFDSGGVDLVIVEHSQLAWLQECIPSRCPVIFNAQNVEHELYDSLSKQGANPIKKFLYRRESRLMKELETNFTNRAAAVWALTDEDVKSIRKMRPRNCPVSRFDVPGQICEQSDIPKCFDVALLGTWTWDANARGLKWFFKEVHPLMDLNLSVHVAGKGADWLKSFAPNVHYHGFVQDPFKFLLQSRVVAIPAVSGGGIQVKTLDGIATGMPIVVTALGIRGINDPPATVFVAESGEDFARYLSLICSGAEDRQGAPAAKRWALERKDKFLKQVEASIFEVMNTEVLCTEI